MYQKVRLWIYVTGHADAPRRDVFHLQACFENRFFADFRHVGGDLLDCASGLCRYTLLCDNLVILIYYASDHIGTANVQTEIILGAFHLCSLFYEVNRVNYLLAKIEELSALDNVRFSLK